MNKRQWRLKGDKAYKNGDYKRAAECYYRALPALPRSHPKITRRNWNKIMFPLPVAVARFSDGEVVRMSFAQFAGYPWRVEAAKQICSNAWANRRATERAAKVPYGSFDIFYTKARRKFEKCVPEIESLIEEKTGTDLLKNGDSRAFISEE